METNQHNQTIHVSIVSNVLNCIYEKFIFTLVFQLTTANNMLQLCLFHLLGLNEAAFASFFSGKLYVGFKINRKMDFFTVCLLTHEMSVFVFFF
jgi:hypothetical protein